MNARKVLALAAVVPLLAGVTSADAATKKKKKAPVKVPVCNLVKDASADATDGPSDAPGVNDPTLDITSADVATNATTLAVAIRLTAVEAAPPDTSPWGRAYDVAFSAAGQTHVVRGIVGPGGTTWAGGKGSGVVDKLKKEVRIWLPLSAFPVKIPAGAKITNIEANTFRWIGGTDVVIGRADTASGAATYSAAWPSCLPIGK